MRFAIIAFIWLAICFQFLNHCGCKMAEGAGKGENPESRKELQVLIDQINSEPHYRVIPKDEYEMLVKNSHMSTKPPITSTPRAPFAHLGIGAKPKFSPRVSLPTPGLLNTSALYQNPNSNPVNLSTYQNPNPTPVKLPTFSGEQIQKGEVSFDVWSYEVRCLKTQYPESVILQSVRSSLKGTAREMLIPLGETATVDIILQKLDDFYGNVYTAENIMQSFYSDYQREGESIVTFGSRLEQTVSRAIRFGHIDEVAKDAMLRSKFWSGLRNHELRNATRNKYETVKDFHSLLREIRQIEHEEKNLKIETTKPVQSNTVCTEIEDHVSNFDLKEQLTELLGQMKKLDARMSRLEQDHENLSNANRDSFQTQTQNSFSGNRGNSYGYRKSDQRFRGRGSFRQQSGNNRGYGNNQRGKPLN